MIAPSRFIETSDNNEAWLEARRLAVTATEVARASTPAGFLDAVKDRLDPQPVEPNDFMRFGSDNEDWISRFIKREHGIMPNRWLIAAEQNPLHMATPDGLSLDHTRISEVKTGGKEPKSIPMAHRRQVQWQFHCTGAVTGVYAFMLRAEINGRLVPAWFEPKTWPVERDDRMIKDLIGTAGRLLDTTKENPND